MEDRLVALGQSRRDVFQLSRRIPARGGRDGALIGGEPDEHGLMAMALADELTEVPLSSDAHLRCPGITQMRVMRPDHDFGLRGALIKERDQ